MQGDKARQRLVRRLLAGQLLGAVLAGLVGLFFSRSAAIGAFLGGMIVVLPHSYFAYRAFRYQGARAAKRVVNSFYAAAAGKMLLSIALFALVFGWVRPLNAPAVFAGYVGVLSLNWLIPLVINPSAQGSGQANDWKSGSEEHGK